MTSEAYRQNYQLIKWKPIKASKAKRVQRQDRPAFHIIRDIEPYRSVVTGEVIGGRRQHRDHLRAHDCIEVGNEKPKPRPPPAMPDARRDVKAAIDMVRGGYRPRPIETYRKE